MFELCLLPWLSLLYTLGLPWVLPGAPAFFAPLLFREYGDAFLDPPETTGLRRSGVDWPLCSCSILRSVWSSSSCSSLALALSFFSASRCYSSSLLHSEISFSCFSSTLPVVLRSRSSARLSSSSYRRTNSESVAKEGPPPGPDESVKPEV